MAIRFNGEHDRARDVLGGEFGVCGAVGGGRPRVGKAGLDQGDPDAGFGGFGADGLGDSGDRPFGGGVKLPGDGDATADRAGEDQVPAGAGVGAQRGVAVTGTVYQLRVVPAGQARKRPPCECTGAALRLRAGATGRLLGERLNAAPAGRYSAKAILGAARGTLAAPATQ